MTAKSKKSELDSLEVYRLALTNVDSQPEITLQMTDIGYTAEVLEQGRMLYQKSLDTYHSWKKVWRQKSAAYRAFDNKWRALQERFITHRNKAKVVFRKDEQATANLRLAKGLPESYLKLIDEIQHFYTEIEANEQYKEQMSRLNVPGDEITAGLSLLNEVLALRATYIEVRGSAQSATNQKKAAFKETDEWMFDFFAVAKIAFKKDPQRLESLGKVVRS